MGRGGGAVKGYGQSNLDRKTFQELRRRKQEEQQNCKQGNRGKEQSWHQVLSKKQKQQERKFLQRVEWLKNNTTSFFVSNLPGGCTGERLWAAFQHFENLEDVFVPRKKDGAGNRFGFIRFKDVTNPEDWLTHLAGTKVDGALVGINTARFNRDGSKPGGSSDHRNGSVFDRLGNRSVFDRLGQKVTHPVSGTGPSLNTGVVGPRGTYKETLVGEKDKGRMQRLHVNFPPLYTKAKKIWEAKSLIGEVKELQVLRKFEDFMVEAISTGTEVRYLGGLKVLITFGDAEEADDFLRNHTDSWSVWFSRLYVWDGQPPVFDRVAWVKVTGVPVSLWDRHVFNRIGERCGRLLVESEASVDDADLSGSIMAILVQSGKKVSEVVSISLKDHSCNSWVEEIEAVWSPSFPLKVSKVISPSESSAHLFESDHEQPESPTPTKPVVKSEFFSAGGRRKWNRRTFNRRAWVTCMGAPPRQLLFCLKARGLLGIRQGRERVWGTQRPMTWITLLWARSWKRMMGLVMSLSGPNKNPDSIIVKPGLLLPQI
ncbi:putative RNA recognition motif domain, nucleotide-binding alpha-beta plait domain superfamily [Helianthus annuus]|nr:putative RNA recognition motif domain, nucleotide-binding alpha-beta plait domain superfamily [Helianthus annuus]